MTANAPTARSIVPALTAPCQIRPAQPHEVPAVLELWTRARSSAASTRDTPEALDTLLGSQHSVLLVALVQGRVRGTLIVGWDGWRGGMYRLAVAPGWRRRGIARRLVDAGHEHLAARGARRVGAIVGRADSTAAALWRAVGYELDDGVERYVKNL
jgi:ribosomal protein S18 acetylase RimI-like enzyme